MALIVQKVYFRAMTSIMLCCLEQKDAYGNGAQAEQETISKRNRIFHAVHCNGGCSALRERLQCTASEMGKTGIVIASPVLDKRKGRKDSLHIRVTVAVPRKFLLSRYGP